jgi:hypothetical protein
MWKLHESFSNTVRRQKPGTAAVALHYFVHRDLDK